MNPVKRLEIVVDELQSRRVTELLDRRGLTGWTILRNVEGRGDRGDQLNDGISPSTANVLILTTCTPEQLDALKEELRSLLRSFGGICLVSDAQWLLH